MIVSVTKSQLDKFRRKAISTPNEIYAVLIGRRLTTSKVVVTSFEYPRMDGASPNLATPNMRSCKEILDEARKRGDRSLGSIHSHPNYPPVMSHTDFMSHVTFKDLVSGIVEVTNRRTRVVFWQHDSSLPCDFIYT